MTTGDVARVLGVTRSGVQWLERTKQLTCVRTVSNWRLFRRREVLRLVEARALARHPSLRVVRPRMARAQLRLPYRQEA